MGKNVAAPAVFDGRPEVPFSARAVFQPVEQDHVVAPRAILRQAAKFGGSGHASAKERMERRLRRLKPSAPGNSLPRSLASRSTTLVPHPSLDDAHHHGEHASGASKNERSSEVVSAAYSLIAEKGFEGLRTREVADKVAINSATLHYYFPTKEALIQDVVEHLMRELRTSRAKPKDPQSALDRLRAEFADLRLRLKEAPEQLAVLTELAVRAWRDPAIARMLQYLDDGWRGHLTSISEAGIAEGVFRADLEVVATADAMMSQLRGLGYQGKLGGKKLDSLIAHIAIQTEYWVRARPQLARRGATAMMKFALLAHSTGI